MATVHINRFIACTRYAVKCGNATELLLFTGNSVWQYRLSDTSKRTHTFGYVLVGFPQKIQSRWFSGERILTTIALPHFMTLGVLTSALYTRGTDLNIRSTWHRLLKF